jgi:hypothetical protein
VIRTGENVDVVLGNPLQSGKIIFALPSGEKISIPVEYVNLPLTRSVSSGSSAPATTPPASRPVVGIQVTGNAINEHCDDGLVAAATSARNGLVPTARDAIGR